MIRSARSIGLLVLLAAVLTAGAPSVLRVRVHSGDTLSELAARHHTTVARLKALNHLHSDTIYAGAILRLPGNAPAAAPRIRTSTGSYLVRSGDNLTVIAKRLHTSVQGLTSRNHLRSTTLLVGQRLSYVVTTRTAAPVRVSRGVAQSAAHHRAVLRLRQHPSKAAVRQLIRKAAKRHGVPTSLALALAYQESGFQQRVVSPVDAIGVMQVLPSTGRALGGIHGTRFDLLKASDNVEAGVVLLKDLLRATGSTPKALAGYYQGLGSLRSVGLLPQTRAYITNVQLLQKRFG
jgi:LysM repeat protein